MLTKASFYLNVISLILGLLHLNSYSQNQNLVSNGSFEEVNHDNTRFIAGINEGETYYDVNLRLIKSYYDNDSTITSRNFDFVFFLHRFLQFSSALNSWKNYSIPAESHFIRYQPYNNSRSFNIFHREIIFDTKNILNEDFKNLKFEYKYGLKDNIKFWTINFPKIPIEGSNFIYLSVQSHHGYITQEIEPIISNGITGCCNLSNTPKLTNKLKSPTKIGRKYKLGFFVNADNWMDTANIPQEPIMLPFDMCHDGELSSFYQFFNQRNKFPKTYLTDCIGAMLTENDLGRYNSGTGNIEYPMETHPPQFRISEPFMSDGEWKELSWEFVADKEYEYLTIGNFWTYDQSKVIKWQFQFNAEDTLGRFCSNCCVGGQMNYHRLNVLAAKPFYNFFNMGYYYDSVYLIDITFELPNDTVVCKGESVKIAERLGREVEWIKEDGSTQIANQLTIIATNPVERIIAKFEDEYDTMFVYTKQPIPYEILHTDSLCSITGKMYNRVEMQSTEPGLWVDWSLNQSQQSGFEFVSSDTGLLQYTLTDSVGCTDSGTLHLGEYCPEFTRSCPFPNAFSPNGDGVNDVISFECNAVKSRELMILNRWGEVVVNNNNLNFAWDGTAKGKPCPPGVYTVIIRYQTYLEPQVTKEYKATLTLVR